MPCNLKYLILEREKKMIYVHCRSLFKLIMLIVQSILIDSFTLLHETEAETANDHITLNSKRPGGSSLQIVNDRSWTAYLSFKHYKRLFSEFIIFFFY